MKKTKVDRNDLPKDVGQCHEMIMGLLTDMEEQEWELQRVRHALVRMLRWRYGPKRERVDENQLFLWAVEQVGTGRDLQEAAPPPRPASSPGRRKGHGRKPLPGHLERRRVLYDLSPDQRQCPECRGALNLLGEEVSERLEYVPASLHVIEEVCRKYVCANGCTVVTAGKPMQPIEKGLPGPGLLAHVAVSKYGDHLPLHRQSGIFERQGVELPRSTLCDWMGKCADLASPLFDLMKKRVLESKVMQTDDTPVGVLDGERMHTRTGRIWTYVGDAEHPFTVYDYTPTRGRDGPMEFMKDYVGYLQADAYAGYEALYDDPKRKVTEVACWAHARRKFYDAKGSDIMRSMVMLAYIRLLYDVEREARDLKLDGKARLALRLAKSVPILDDIKAYMEKEQRQVLPKSPEAQAISYALSNWKALTRYCEDENLEIDNNGAERSLRGIAVGRKNWMFFGSDAGGRTAAVLTSFVMTCKRLKIDPFAYLRDVFDRISAHPANRLEELLPDRWQAARQSATV
jgi:transposase